MKRTPTKIIVLLVMLAAVLFLTGCAKEPEDPTAEKGAWVKKEFLGSKTSNPGASNPDFFSLDADSQVVTFLVDEAARTAAATPLNAISYSRFNTYSYKPIAGDYIGVEVAVKKESGDEGNGYGIRFLDKVEYSPSLRGSYFRILLSSGSYTIDYFQLNPSTYSYENTEICGWTQNNAIKPLGQENVIRVATRNDGKLSISINGTFITTINVPSDAFKVGEVSAVGGVGYDDYPHEADAQKGWPAVVDPDDVKITWKFNKFQQ